MTVSEEEIIAATEAKTNIKDGANIPGFHLEGPFINVQLKGAQNEKYVIPPTMELIKKCTAVKKISLAPEVEGSLEFIRECPAVVSLGHTTTDYDTAKAAFEAGAKCLTHTYNCMPGLHHRNPGPIPAGAECGAYAELICDGIHVHPAMVRLLVGLYGTDTRPVPAPLVHASLLLVELSYTQRAPVTQTNLYTVPYAFDMMVKPYMRLADRKEANNG
jgi:N-acetylglucosamine-6-phosphate deacetylase